MRRIEETNYAQPSGAGQIHGCRQMNSVQYVKSKKGTLHVVQIETMESCKVNDLSRQDSSEKLDRAPQTTNTNLHQPTTSSLPLTSYCHGFRCAYCWCRMHSGNDDVETKTCMQ